MYFGYMGGGLARQLADRYPNLEREYSQHCNEVYNSFDVLSGTIFWFNTNDKYIANLFSQEKNFNTNYCCLKKCLETVERGARLTGKTVAIPYRIGCGIANGEWDKVYKIIQDVFKDSKVQCTLYKLEV